MRRSLAALLAASALLAAAAPAGAHFNPKKAIWGATSINGESQFPLYQDLGVAIFQIQVRWDAVAPTRPANPADPADPAYRWPSDVDYAVSEAARYGMRVAVQVIGSPPWANGGHGGDRLWAPRKATDYARFSAAAARRYPDVHLWMIWGEPDRAVNFRPLKRTSKSRRRLTSAEARFPRLYARMLDGAYGALKSVSARNVVIGGNTPSLAEIPPKLWIRYMRLPGGKPPRLDMYGHNPFTARRPNLKSKPFVVEGGYDFSDLNRLRSFVQQNLARSRHQRIRLFLSEWTIPTARGDREFAYYVDPSLQASWITSAWRIVNGSSAFYALGWIHVYDDDTSTGGLIRTDGTRKPGYSAFQAG